MFLGGAAGGFGEEGCPGSVGGSGEGGGALDRDFGSVVAVEVGGVDFDAVDTARGGSELGRLAFCSHHLSKYLQNNNDSGLGFELTLMTTQSASSGLCLLVSHPSYHAPVATNLPACLTGSPGVKRFSAFAKNSSLKATTLLSRALDARSNESHR